MLNKLRKIKKATRDLTSNKFNLLKSNRSQLMIPIPDTIIWVIATILIAFLCIIIVSLVFFLTKGKGSPTSAQIDSEVFPEKAEVLYSILSSKVNNERVDDIIARDGSVKNTNIQTLLKKIPTNNPDTYWTFNLATEDTTSVVDMVSSVNKFRISFLIFSDKKLNTVLDRMRKIVAYPNM